MHKRLLPVLTGSDKELPYYLVDAACNWGQEHVIRPDGYLHQWIQCVKGEGELVTGGKTFRVKEGHAMLLLKGVPHEYYATSSSWIVNWVVFDGHQVFTMSLDLKFSWQKSKVLWSLNNPFVS